MKHPLTHNATWQPCTGNNSVRQFLETRLFPVSFRNLIPQWYARDSPPLRTLRAPWAMSSDYDAALDTLVSITDAQEEMIVDAVAGASHSTPSFAAFQNHLHIYCSVYAELTATGEQEQTAVYEQLQQSLLQSFAFERRQCMDRGHHKCIGRVLWGDVYAMPLEEIKKRLAEESRRFRAAQQEAKYMAHLRASWSQPAASSPPRPLGFKGRAVSLACLSDITKTASPPASPSSWRNGVYKPLAIDVASVLRLSSLASSEIDESEDSDDGESAEVAVEDYDPSHRHSINTQMGSCWSASSYGSRDNDDELVTTDDDDEAKDADVTLRFDMVDVASGKRSELASELAQFRFLPYEDGERQNVDTVHAVGIAV